MPKYEIETRRFSEESIRALCGDIRCCSPNCDYRSGVSWCSMCNSDLRIKQHGTHGRGHVYFREEKCVHLTHSLDLFCASCRFDTDNYEWRHRTKTVVRKCTIEVSDENFAKCAEGCKKIHSKYVSEFTRCALYGDGLIALQPGAFYRCHQCIRDTSHSSEVCQLIDDK